VLFAGEARADPPFKPELEFKPKAPGEKVHFQLEDAEISELVRVVGGLTGKRFVIANNKIKSIKATIVAPEPITVAEAYQAFLSVLQANGLTVLERGTFYQIVESKDIERQNTAVVPSGSAPDEDRYVTQIQRLRNLRAEDIAKDFLSKFQTRDGSIVPYGPGNLLIMTDTGSNIRRMMRLLEEIDVPSGAEDKLYFEPIHYVPAADVEKKLTEIFDLKKRESAQNGTLHITKLASVEQPNFLVVVASPESYSRLLAIVQLLDQPVSNEGQINVVSLQHADAKKLVGPLTEALGGTAAPAPAQSGPGGQSGSTSGSAGGAAHGGGAAVSVLESPVKISAEETTNSILVTSSPRDFAAIKMVIDRLDRPKRQVYIEAVVMEISADRTSDFGVAWNGASGSSSGILGYGGFRAASSIQPDASALQAFTLGIQGPQIQLPFSIPIGTSTITSIPSIGAAVTALASTQGSDILSTPSIMASDNTPAELKVQLNTPLNPNAPPASIIAGGTTLPGSPSSANLQKIGPRIKVTPHLNESDEVRLDVDEQISDIQSSPAKDDTYGSVTFIERSAITTLTVKDEETVVIGGLIRNQILKSESKVPVLGDIPVLGALFRTTHDEHHKSNLVLVLTPHIIRDRTDSVRVFTKKMEERQEMIDHNALFSGDKWEPPRSYDRGHGLLHVIRESYREDRAQRALDKMRAPLPIKVHDPQPPMELPAPIQTWGTPAPAGSGAPPKSAPGVERIEK